MAMAIDGELDIRKITKESFRAEARHIGLGARIAMRRFEQMQNSFERALAQAKEELQDEGYPDVAGIYEQILRKTQPNHHIQDLVARVISGDMQAFEAIYQATYRQVYYTCLSFLRNEQNTLDMM